MADRSNLWTRFFKVILPTTTAQQKLKLPDKFVEEFWHRLPNVARLVDHSGGVWCVTLVKEEEKIWLHHGWEKFYEDHSIQYGYFLLFKYTGNSTFKVRVFDMTATEVPYPTCNSRKRRSDSLATEQLACPLRSVAPNGRVVQARRDKNRSSRGTKRGKKAVYAAGASSLTYPSFTVEMKANLTPQWVVYVPARFAKDHLPKSPNYMELFDSNGKKWRVHVNLRPNCNTVRALSTGWAEFAKAKEIKVGDTCVFEVIPGNKPALKVSIYHNTGRVPRLL